MGGSPGHGAVYSSLHRMELTFGEYHREYFERPGRFPALASTLQERRMYLKCLIGDLYNKPFIR